MSSYQVTFDEKYLQEVKTFTYLAGESNENVNVWISKARAVFR